MVNFIKHKIFFLLFSLSNHTGSVLAFAEPGGTFEKTSNNVDILIVGSGPTGLTAAAEALRLGLTVRTIDRKTSRITDQSRALIVHARTMELLHALGNGRVTERLMESGIKLTGTEFHVGKKVLGVNNSSELPWGDTEYPYFLALPQYDTERILQEEVERLGGVLEWETSLSALSQIEDLVKSTLVLPDGTEECVFSRWVIGCDGGRSTTRDLVRIELDREKPEGFFILADFKTESTSFSHNSINAFLHPQGICGMIPLSSHPQAFRIVARAPADFTSRVGDLTNDTQIDLRYIDNLVSKRTGVDVNCFDLEWATSFQVSYGVANSYRNDRVFLAGDAAHVHSPAGGQGMNYGIQDAFNLIWKLAWVQRLNDKALAESILDSYDAERRPLALSMVKGTRLATRVIMTTNPILRKVRELVIPFFLQTNFAKRTLSRVVGMLNLHYDAKSPIISKPISGSFACSPGDRLPNFRTVGGRHLYEDVDRERYSWVVMHAGEPIVERKNSESCGLGGLKVVHAIVDKEHSQNMQREHAVLVRPDLYVTTVDMTIEGAWEKFSNMLGLDAQSNM